MGGKWREEWGREREKERESERERVLAVSVRVFGLDQSTIVRTPCINTACTCVDVYIYMYVILKIVCLSHIGGWVERVCVCVFERERMCVTILVWIPFMIQGKLDSALMII